MALTVCWSIWRKLLKSARGVAKEDMLEMGQLVLIESVLQDVPVCWGRNRPASRVVEVSRESAPKSWRPDSPR